MTRDDATHQAQQLLGPNGFAHQMHGKYCVGEGEKDGPGMTAGIGESWEEALYEAEFGSDKTWYFDGQTLTEVK